jgi:hypothetical protein
MKPIMLLAMPLLIAAAPLLTKVERGQALAAAGFVGAKTCATGNAGWPKSEFEVEAVDLNGDGKVEAFVIESNSACYGNTGSAFTIVGKDATGKWRNLGGDTGVPVPLTTKRSGWIDVRVGGPGFGAMPVLRWDGKRYR